MASQLDSKEIPAGKILQNHFDLSDVTNQKTSPRPLPQSPEQLEHYP